MIESPKTRSCGLGWSISSTKKYLICWVSSLEGARPSLAYIYPPFPSSLSPSTPTPTSSLAWMSLQKVFIELNYFISHTMSVMFKMFHSIIISFFSFYFSVLSVFFSNEYIFFYIKHMHTKMFIPMVRKQRPAFWRLYMKNEKKNFHSLEVGLLGGALPVYFKMTSSFFWMAILGDLRD